MVERLADTEMVGGSTPLGSTSKTTHDEVVFE